MKTDAQGLEAIETAMRIARTDKKTAIARLFAISMVFYRAPIGDQAQGALHELMDKESVMALYFISGAAMAVGGNGAAWERLAFPDESQVVSPTTGRPAGGRQIGS